MGVQCRASIILRPSSIGFADVQGTAVGKIKTWRNLDFPFQDEHRRRTIQNLNETKRPTLEEPTGAVRRDFDDRGWKQTLATLREIGGADGGSNSESVRAVALNP